MKKHKVLFVCHGNICRSPMAEYILKDMVEKSGMADEFEIASAGRKNSENLMNYCSFGLNISNKLVHLQFA